MNPNEYQDMTAVTELYSYAANDFLMMADQQPMQAVKTLSMMYCVIKLNGEAGEFAETFGKAYRNKEFDFNDLTRRYMMLELGDILWYVARLADLMGYKLEDVMDANIRKLQKRQEQNAIANHGGDDDS
jgi:NTP pyrophosphatase (non-canonical NTP hydrolase)